MSEYTQISWKGGMNMLDDDTRIQQNQYYTGFNLRNRYDILEPVLQGKVDVAAPIGLKQGILTFGNYIIIFVAGYAYYRYYTATGWTRIDGFRMSSTAERFWTEEVPVATTLYGRFANPYTTVDPVSGNFLPVADQTPSANQGVRLNGIAGSFAGNLPGLLVQDNINQPQFIYLHASTGKPVTRKTQNYDEWSVTYDSDYNITEDKREYVPIGNSMAWVDGILYITSQDFTQIYRSVSGRPLDFVVNIDMDGQKGGDAASTAYNVGVGGISCLRQMSNNALFVAASNANFLVSKNMTENSPKIFGEYTFIRTFLFNATCLSDRAILDSIGDTKFIDLTGVRSFNAIQQEQNEGRNSAFSATIQSAFAGLVQDYRYSAAILYDNYEFYSMGTIFGPAIAVYDTINQCWTSFDLNQTAGSRIKMFAKIELTIQRLYAITEDDNLYTLYIGPLNESPRLRPISASPLLLRTETGDGVNPKGEIKLTDFRCILNKVDQDSVVTVTPYVNNRLTKSLAYVKNVPYKAPTVTSSEVFPDVNTQLVNLLFSFTDCGQGWKTFCLVEWEGSGSLVQFTYVFEDLTPMNPLLSQR